MKILIVVPRVWNGGAEVHVSSLALLYRANQHEVTLVVDERFPEDPARRSAIDKSGCRLVKFKNLDGKTIPIRLASQWRTLANSLRPRSFDVVFCESYGNSLPFYSRYVKRHGGKVIWHEQMDGVINCLKPLSGFHYPDQKPYNAFFRTLLRRADAIVVGCNKGAANLKSFYGVNKPTLVAPSLLPDYSTTPAEERHIGDGPVRIGVFGHLHGQKGTGPLLDLWPNLMIGPAELHLYGQDWHGYEAQAKRASLSNVVFHHGYVQSELPKLMDATDLALIPSLFEGYPLTLLECMMFGVPTVITDVGAAPEVAAGSPDIRLAKLTEQELKQAIEQHTRDLRSGKLSRVRIQQHYYSNFSNEHFAKQYLALVSV